MSEHADPPPKKNHRKQPKPTPQVRRTVGAQEAAREAARDKGATKEEAQALGPLDEKEILRIKFFESPFFAWSSFCEHERLDDVATRQKYPTREWVAEKRYIHAERAADKVGEAIFQHRGRYQQDVMKTLREYPQSADRLKAIIDYRLNKILTTIREDEETKTVVGRKSQFDKIRTSEIFFLAQSIKSVTDTKYKALLLQDWTVKAAEEAATPPPPLNAQPGVGADDQDSQPGFKIEVVGAEKLTDKDLQRFFDQYLDKPLEQHGNLEELAEAEEAQIMAESRRRAEDNPPDPDDDQDPHTPEEPDVHVSGG